MKFTLMLKNEAGQLEEKTFTQTFVPFIYKRKVADLFNKVSKGKITEEKSLDMQLELIVDMFQKQFTLTDIEHGLDVKTSTKQIYNIFYHEILEYPEYEEQLKIAEHAMKEIDEEVNDFLAEAPQTVE
ncbi:hypothetical protein AKG34_13355 [Peribacillus butanolivorans]|uniref:phage tail assembly chaperone G n=1 Tax=Peribacillus butanolivorans TaxID=421767 RepID=UPI0006A71091|nr:hypothetical protein [Peribacillus butanolivorans]KON69636.1 hypothetical protein AKG34_13355 [Peribacillus butanolivorans]